LLTVESNSRNSGEMVITPPFCPQVERKHLHDIEKGHFSCKFAFEPGVPTGFIAKMESGREEKKYNIGHLSALAGILPDATLQD